MILYISFFFFFSFFFTLWHVFAFLDLSKKHLLKMCSPWFVARRQTRWTWLYKLCSKQVGSFQSCCWRCCVISWGNYSFWLSSKYAYHLFHFIPAPGSWLMFNVSVLMASSTYSTMAISASGNQRKQWRRETLAVWKPSKQAFISIICSITTMTRNNRPSEIYHMIKGHYNFTTLPSKCHITKHTCSPHISNVISLQQYLWSI